MVAACCVLRAATPASVDVTLDPYERLLAGTGRADILNVYRNLQAASQERHLHAFRRCAERGGEASEHGHGRRLRRRRRGES